MTIQKLDNFVYYSLVLYALASSISIAAANIGLSFALLFGLIRYYQKPVRYPGDRGLVKIIVFFWVATLISAIFAYTHPIAFSKWWAYVFRSLPFFLAATFVDTHKKLFTLLSVMAVSLFVADCPAIRQGLLGNRAQGFSSMPMIMAGYLAQMIPLLAVVALEEKRLGRRVRLLMGAVILLSFPAMVYTGVRGAWIGLFAVIVLYLVFCLKSRARMLAILAVILIIGFVGVSIPSVQDRWLSTFNPADQGRKGRLLVWEGAWRMFTDHRAVGVGPGNFQEIYLGRYRVPEEIEGLGHAHNNFLQILAENGMVGFIGFISMFAYFLYYLFKQSRKSNIVATGVLLATISLLIQGLTEFNFGDSAVIRMFWFILGLAVANARIGAESPDRGVLPQNGKI